MPNDLNLEYNIEEAFQAIENELLESMSRNLSKHINEEAEIGVSYEMWQAQQLKILQEFKYTNSKIFTSRYSKLNGKIKELLKQTENDARTKQENEILEKYTGKKKRKKIKAYISKANNDKLNALIKSVTNDFKKAEYATLRMMDDQYRKIIFNAQIYLNTGSGTLKNAIDMATKDFYAGGLTSIEYKNGARVNIASYSEMALRTGNKRAYLIGEGGARDEFDEHLVIVTRRGVACPKCQQFCGRVCIDDVYSCGKPDGKHPLLSSFVEGGLFHPNCKDTISTYFEGITDAKDSKMSLEEKNEAQRVYDLEQQQRYNERNIRKYKRLEENSLDPANKEKYALKTKEWQNRNKEFIADNDKVLRRKYSRESITGEKKAAEATGIKLYAPGK